MSKPREFWLLRESGGSYQLFDFDPSTMGMPIAEYHAIEKSEADKLAEALEPFAKAYKENDLTFDWSKCGEALSKALAEYRGTK